MTVRLLHGDCREVLPRLPDGSVHCIVTSPPYFGLRDYGTARWQGGDPDCSHLHGTLVSRKSGLRNDGRDHVGPYAGEKAIETGMPFRKACGQCGARRVDQQIGLEPTPDAYVAELVAVFREARRVLRNDGTLWVNLGDSYSSGGRTTQEPTKYGTGRSYTFRAKDGLKPKDLLGIPWRVAFALQADGWFLRQDIIWSKPNPMPESVTDRCTKAHEYVFLLSKSARYFYDAEAISEPAVQDEFRPTFRGGAYIANSAFDNGGDGGRSTDTGNIRAANAMRNRRSVWTIATQPYKGAHFATMPPDLAELCIKAGTSERGCCPTCKAPWVRMLTKSAGGKRTWHDHSDDLGAGQSQCKHGQAAWETYTPRQTLGWAPSCACPEHTPRPCTVLDPFAGAGTTGLVADRLGRDAVLIELNPEYSGLGRARIEADAGMFAQIAEADLRPA